MRITRTVHGSVVNVLEDISKFQARELEKENRVLNYSVEYRVRIVSERVSEDWVDYRLWCLRRRRYLLYIIRMNSDTNTFSTLYI